MGALKIWERKMWHKITGVESARKKNLRNDCRGENVEKMMYI